MNLALRIDNNIVAIIVSIIFLINISSHLDKKERKNKAFVAIFMLNTFQLIIETLTCIINKKPYSWLIPITNLLHVFLFALAPIVTYKWYVFANLWIRKDVEYKWKNNILLLIPLLINTFFVVSSPFLKLTFYINGNNVYQRGILFFVPGFISYFYLLCGFVLIYLNRKKISRIEFLTLLLFGVFAAVAGFIQILFYGFLLMWSSIAFSLIMLYLYLQKQMMNIDYLTGAWTRENFTNYLTHRIGQEKVKSFAIVFIDLDDFKKINDTFGHAEGDRALVNLVNSINSILKKEDSVTRYGGDEFVLFLNVATKQEVDTILMRVSDALLEYNKFSNLSYELSFSYGYELYNFEKEMTADEYIKHVDKLMYHNKNNKKLDNKAE